MTLLSVAKALLLAKDEQMEKSSGIDVTFDFKSEAQGRDADDLSPTLRKYHAALWSKPLKSGAVLAFDASRPRSEGYLSNLAPDGPTMVFGSDAITHSYTSWTKPAALVIAKDALNESQRKRYLNTPYTIGSAMIWPIRSANKPTINQARGTRQLIDDRIDLTLECIRRHYLERTDSPLSDVLEAYGDFFQLFDGFAEFIDFFLLNDLVTDDYGEVRHFLPPNDFSRRGCPQSVEEYVTYRENVLEFIGKRQQRIAVWSRENSLLVDANG